MSAIVDLHVYCSRSDLGRSGANHISRLPQGAAWLKASYDPLLTNRVIATPSVESNVFSKRQEDRGLGSGVSNVELGLHLRYEISHKFAHYIGVTWERSFGKTADLRGLESGPVAERRMVAGLRVGW